MSDSLLDSVNGPADVRDLPADALPKLVEEIRRRLLDTIARQGGHLASNLGVVELTVALLRAFDLETDRIVWDTGHQGYVYKLLTGRQELFESLRADDGCCGFLHRDESPFDVFGAGHAGTALSAALGVAVARDRRAEPGRVLAVVGDGALGCGTSLEGLNNVIETTGDFILILNDNRMSIAPNVGAMSRYLNRIISNQRYRRFKQRISDLVRSIPGIGPPLRRAIHRLEEATKSVLVPGVIFEELGLRYIGPLDGHDLPRLIETLQAVRKLREPLVVHVLTQKGRGYSPAEDAPEVFHGTGSFDVNSGAPDTASGVPDETFSDVLGNELCQRMAADDRIVAITAGMCHGTGLDDVRERFPDRLFDVGIAEEHAVVFAAGLATAGLRPVVAIYASFIQRAVDYVFHDVCLQNLPVVFCLDRAGVVSDGPTHHGIQDLGCWRSMPNISVLQPSDGWELRAMLAAALDRCAPALIRYPKAGATAMPGVQHMPIEWGCAEVVRSGKDVMIWACGREAVRALRVAAGLADRGVEATVVNVRFAMPLDTVLLREHLSNGTPVVVLEDHCVEGGLGSVVRETAAATSSRILARGWPRDIIPWGTPSGIRRKFRLDEDALIEEIARFVVQETAP